MLLLAQRGHVTPCGQRKSARRARHLASSPKVSISLTRFISGLNVCLTGVFIIMSKSKKKAHQMTDKELLHDLFPKKLIEKLKKIAHAARKKPKKRKK